MCDNTFDPKTTIAADEVDGTFLVIRGATPENLHVKGQYDNLVEAEAKRSSLIESGHEAVIVLVPTSAVGACGHSEGRRIVEMAIDAPTTKVVVLQ